MRGREARRHPLSVTLQSTLQSPAQRGLRVTAGPCRWKHPTLCTIKLSTCLTSECCTRAARAVRRSRNPDAGFTLYHIMYCHRRVRTGSRAGVAAQNPNINSGKFDQRVHMR